jgi:hypothetical protein
MFIEVLRPFDLSCTRLKKRQNTSGGQRVAGSNPAIPTNFRPFQSAVLESAALRDFEGQVWDDLAAICDVIDFTHRLREGVVVGIAHPLRNRAADHGAHNLDNQAPSHTTYHGRLFLITRSPLTHRPLSARLQSTDDSLLRITRLNRRARRTDGSSPSRQRATARDMCASRCGTRGLGSRPIGGTGCSRSSSGVPGRESHDPHRGGMGLGLPIARRLVETQAGRIWLVRATDQRNRGRKASRKDCCYRMRCPLRV